MKNGSGFENLDELAVKPGVDTPRMKQRREKLEQQLIKVPVSWANKLTKTKRRSTLLVALHLLRLSWKKNSKSASVRIQCSCDHVYRQIFVWSLCS